ncbi:hypothetical protein ERJ75_001457100 [Trypanosoma vivax]|uniref:ADG1 protein n=1 Tax=Trypanosoma vivax (strain Y486) TaxID=1055687 RepID=G0TVW8_TRYVY|nr:hypothetical protein TRVL_04199 [Trypanosoma vivax]KAH8606980.1 hypothetical protein ERJ75_001460900 [Trypanosoma vivax]KAH8607297.1 hypothetical protein ERJ75_001457100 [Trypanosoma vivax]CCC48084.1 conserved hypothetical protein [Trypanosoma vivax Y486]
MPLPLLRKNLIQPLLANPLLGLCVYTGAANALLYVWYARSTRATLRETQQRCKATAESAFVRSRELLKGLEEEWARDMKARDGSVRRLELQNVEQTRSIARLDAAMRLCIAPGTQAPS